MADLLKCSIDSLHAHSIEIFNPDAAGTHAAVKAKIGYGVAGKPVGEVSVDGLEQNEDVIEAARNLVAAVEKAFAPTVGIISELDEKKPEEDPPPGITDF